MDTYVNLNRNQGMSKIYKGITQGFVFQIVILLLFVLSLIHLRNMPNGHLATILLMALGVLSFLIYSLFWDYPVVGDDSISIRHIIYFFIVKKYEYENISRVEVKPGPPAGYYVVIITKDGKKHFRRAFGYMPVKRLDEFIKDLRDRGVDVRDFFKS